MKLTFFSISMEDQASSRRRQIIEAVRAIPAGTIAHADADSLCAEIIKPFEFEEPPIVRDDAERDEPTFPLGTDDAYVEVYIPFQGNPDHFTLYHSFSPLPKPSYVIDGSTLRKRYRLQKDRIDNIDQEVAADIKQIREYSQHVRTMVPRYNENFFHAAKEAFEHRLYEVKQNQQAVATLSKSTIRLRKRSDGTETVVIPVERKVIPVTRQPKPSKPLEQEYEIGVKEYDDILSTISSMVCVMERTPEVFVEMHEEALRWILLVGLNGIYEGQATGETFNGAGKTDILIRKENKNAFIAECLMWGGPKKLTDKMDDQLFKYAMWRDSKLALIVFNRKGNFTHVVETMKTTVKDHPQFVHEIDWKHQSGARYMFRRHDDPQRHFTLTALAFEVPVSS